MEPLGWLRVRIDPSVPQWWRSNGNFVVGHADDLASSAVEVSHQATLFATLTQLLDGSHSAHALLQSGQAMGIPAEAVRSFLITLAESGHIHEVEVTATPLIAHGAIRNVRHLARARGDVESFALRKRESFRILIVGIGAVAAQLHINCQQAGLSTGWRPDSERKVRLDDCIAVGLTPDAVGMRWSELTEEVYSPHLVVVVDQSISASEIASRFPQSLALPLTVHQRRMSIGPLLNAEGGLCSRCVDDSRAKADPDWSYRHIQISSADIAPPVMADAFRDAFVGSAMAWILELADTDSTHGLDRSSWELFPPTPAWQQRIWSSAAECRCNDFQQVTTAV